VADRIKLRRDTAANWAATNPVLAQGEPGFETDTDFLKVGDGVTAWNSLGYVAGVGAFVSKSGDTMTGPLSVPAGASGAQVPQRQEVVGLTGNESIGGVKTFTSKPKVPAGATADEVPQAQEIFGKSQSWQTVTRVVGTTYTNSTGKPIVLHVYGVTTANAGYILIKIDGQAATVSTYPQVLPAALGVTATIPDGSTYLLESGSMGTLTAREYR
jgi:hypothetical protein